MKMPLLMSGRSGDCISGRWMDLYRLASRFWWTWGIDKRQVIFHEEYARAGGPGRVGHISDIARSTLYEFGTTDQCQRFLPGILRGHDFWCGAIRAKCRIRFG